MHWIYSNSVWSVQAFFDQSLMLGPVLCCHRNAVKGTVGPVDVAVNPVNSQAFRRGDLVANQGDMVRQISSLVYGRAGK